MPKFIMTELVDISDVITARLGAGTGAGNNLTDAEQHKFVKLVGESRYDLCAQGDQIEGRIAAIETATQDGYTIGGVLNEGRLYVTFDGLQATPGTGNLAIGDYVVCGTPVAKGTALVFGTPAKVCKATAAANTLNFKWRVVSLGSAGTGAPGTQGLVELVG
jgi:hypothetical protein